MGLIGDMITTILKTGMAVAGITALILDNLLPGATPAERGLEVWAKTASEEAWQQAEAEWASLKEGETRPV